MRLDEIENGEFAPQEPENLLMDVTRGSGDDLTAQLHNDLKRRARWMDVWAFAVLFTIILLLAGGATVFIYAPQIAKEDLRSEFKRRLDNLHEENKAAQDRQNTAYTSIADRVKTILTKCNAKYDTSLT